jgi:hypothetical protein
MHCPWKRDGPLRAQMMRLDVSVGSAKSPPSLLSNFHARRMARSSAVLREPHRQGERGSDPENVCNRAAVEPAQLSIWGRGGRSFASGRYSVSKIAR